MTDLELGSELARISLDALAVELRIGEAHEASHTGAQGKFFVEVWHEGQVLTTFWIAEEEVSSGGVEVGGRAAVRFGVGDSSERERRLPAPYGDRSLAIEVDASATAIWVDVFCGELRAGRT